MINHIKIGPVIIRTGSKNLAPWGFPRLRVGGLSLWSWSNTGEWMPASYHPRSSITWLWSVAIRWQPRWRLGVARSQNFISGEWRADLGPLAVRCCWQERMPRREGQ